MPIPGIRRFESITFGNNGLADITVGQSTVPKVHATISNPHHSFYNFGFQTQVPRNIPKLKHTFMVEFVLNKDVLSQAARDGGAGSVGGQPLFLKHSLEAQPYDKELTFAVKSFDRPKINIDLQTLNQYNKKRLIQQQLEYQAVNVRFYDAGNNAAQKLVKEYLQFYFGDQRTISERDWSNDIINEELKFSRSGTGWGFNPISDELYFFKEINIYQFYGRRRYDKFTYIHPKIQSIDLDSGDYSASEVLEINLTLMYEGVIMELDKELFPIPKKDATALYAITEEGIVSDINEKFRLAAQANVPQLNESPPAEVKSGTLPSNTRPAIDIPQVSSSFQNNQVNRASPTGVTEGTVNTSNAIINQNGTLITTQASLRLTEANRIAQEAQETLLKISRQKESVLTNRAGDTTIEDTDTNDTVDRLEKHDNSNAFDTRSA